MAYAITAGYGTIRFRDDKENKRDVKIPMGEVDLAAADLGDVSGFLDMMFPLAEAYDNCTEAAVEDVFVTLHACDPTQDTLAEVNEGSRLMGFVEDTVKLMFQKSDGTNWETFVAAPKTNPAGGANILNGDNYTVDEGDSNVSSLIAALKAGVSFLGVGETAITLAEYIGGYLINGDYKAPKKGVPAVGHED